jgi:hypothetical protein
MVSSLSWIILVVALTAVANAFVVSKHSLPLKQKKTSLCGDTKKGDNSFNERIESIKTAIFAGVGGSVAFAPYAILSGALQSPPFNGQWEFNHDMFAVTIALFGITYRYALRDSTNPQLRYGVIGAFSLTRILNLIVVPSTCSAIPLNCGPPFFYVSTDMILQGLGYGLETALGFGGAAIVVDYCFYKGFIKKFVE